MNRSEWDTTNDAVALARFAALRVPRRHLVLAISSITKEALEAARLGGANASLGALAVAAVKAWCLHELSDDELRRAREAFENDELWDGWSAALTAVSFLLNLALWHADPAPPGLSWDIEKNPELFVQLTGALLGHLRQSLDDSQTPSAERLLAKEFRVRVLFPPAVERDWVPQLPLIIAGAQVLSIADWDIVSVAPVDAPHELSPEQLVQRDQLLADAPPASLEQATERHRVEDILASRHGSPAILPPSFTRTVSHLDESLRVASHLLSSAAPEQRLDIDDLADRAALVGGLGIAGAACVLGAVFTVYDGAAGAFRFEAVEPEHGFFVLFGMGLLGAAARVWRRLSPDDARRRS